MTEFLSDVQTLREKARQEIEKGPVTAAYGADVKRVVDVLNTALATEIVCVLRYRQHHFAAKGVHGETVAEEFLVHSNEEQDHADKLAARITQLGGVPDFDPTTAARRAHSQYETSTDLTEMIRENLVAERIAIQAYTEIVTWLGENDPTTRRVVEDILAVEEEHADDMLGFLEKSSGEKSS